MADKMTCPACDSYTSSILQAFKDGRPCPVCGLSNRAAHEVLDAERRAITEEMAEKVRLAVLERDRAQVEVQRLQRKLGRLQRAMKDALAVMDTPDVDDADDAF
jgi:DNA repair exonuclease SbcCD ATPase subunit